MLIRIISKTAHRKLCLYVSVGIDPTLRIIPSDLASSNNTSADYIILSRRLNPHLYHVYYTYKEKISPKGDYGKDYFLNFYFIFRII